MGQVSITINNRTYRLACDAGEEDRLAELATYVKGKIELLTAEIGHAGDERLMLMAALQIADELWDARLGAAATPATAAAHDDTTEPEQVRRLKTLAAKMAASAGGDGGTGGPDLPAPNASKNRRRDVA